MIYQNIIIGGGAAGLFAAANINRGNSLLIESGKKLGQKILITGGGMCNITNMDKTEEFVTKFGHRVKANFLKPALLNLSTESTRNWLNSIGLDLTIRDDGKVFPKSLKAQSLIDALHREATKSGIEFKFNTKVTDISYLNNNFIINSKDQSFTCKNLIIATGGLSFPGTGSDGSLYPIIESLGHNIIPPTPCLTSVKILNYPFKSLSGISIKGAFIELFRKGESKRYLQTTGDILFTHRGLSGPGILNNSRLIKNFDLLKISLIPCKNRESKREELIDIFNSSGKRSTKRVLKEIGVTTALIEALTSYLGLDRETAIKQLNKKSRNSLLNNLLGFSFNILEKTGFNTAMATAGGVDIKEVDRKSMESKLIPNLYFAGEVLDIDGDTGGYNIQAAFSTSKLITNNINKSDTLLNN